MIVRIALICVALCTTVAAQTVPAGGKLDQQVKAKITGFQGHISLYAKNLDTGMTYSLSGEQPVRTASTIKLAIMTECFALANEGKLRLSEMLTLTADEKVSGSGLLQEFSDGGQLPISDLIDL